MTQVETSIKESMKSRDKVRLSAMRYLKAQLLENKVSKSPKDEMDIVIGLHKKMVGSLDNFPEGNELRIKTEEEIKIYEEFLPSQLSEDEVKSMISEIVKTSGSNMGAIMKELQPMIKGRFDGKKASILVRSVL